MEFVKQFHKDLGRQTEVMDALPYAVVGGAFYGSFSSPLASAALRTPLNHVVPNGQQLKILFLRFWTEEDVGAKFRIFQTNPTATGQTGTVEAYPVVGSVPAGARDYPFLEAAGSELDHGSLSDPIHVCEGSIDFSIEGATPSPATGARYGVVWWGVEKNHSGDETE